MKNHIAVLMKTAEYLSQEPMQSELNLMQDALENRFCYISFIGRFSAGKSRLINNLLQLDLLPSGTVETTPVMTYIRYGKPEIAVHFINGEEVHKGLNDLKDISQCSDMNCDTISHIDVFVEHPLLANGVVFIDTPGLNTTIEKHESLFADALNISSMIIYVAGHSPSLVDIEKIKTICESKCDFVIVRTHCDEINKSEETFEDAIAADARVFREAEIQNRCYYISNEAASRYFDNIAELRDYLLQVSDTSYEQIKAAIGFKCQRIAIECISLISEQKNALNAQRYGEEEKLNAQKKAVEKAIIRIKTQISSIESEIGFTTQRVERDLEGSVRRKIDAIIETSAEEIRSSSPLKPFESWMKSFLSTKISSVINEIKMVLNDYYFSLKQQIDFDAELMRFDIAISDYTSFLETESLEKQEINFALERELTRQKEIEQELTALVNSDDYSILQHELAEIEQELMHCSMQCDEIPPYTPQLIQIDSGKAQPSQIAKSVGNIADWVTLLIPGGQVPGILSKAGNSSKVVGGLAKAIGKSEKICKIIKNGDTVKDVAFALKNISKTYATQKRVAQAQKVIQTASKTANAISKSAKTIRESSPEPTVLDYFTISYWAGKIGEKFDTPPRYAVDLEYENEYRKAQQEAKQRLADIRRQEYEKKCQMNLFVSRQEQLEAEKRLLIDDIEKINAEVKSKELEIRAKAEKKALSLWKNATAEAFIQGMNEQTHSLLIRCKQELPGVLVETKKQSLSELHDSLTQQEMMLSSVLSNNNDQCENKIIQLDLLLEELRKYGYSQ